MRSHDRHMTGTANHLLRVWHCNGTASGVDVEVATAGRPIRVTGDKYLATLTESPRRAGAAQSALGRLSTCPDQFVQFRLERDATGCHIVAMQLGDVLRVKYRFQQP